MQTLNNWTPVAVIIFGYAIGLYIQRTWLGPVAARIMYAAPARRWGEGQKNTNRNA